MLIFYNNFSQICIKTNVWSDIINYFLDNELFGIEIRINYLT